MADRIVPRTTEVIPGADVSIVLKADQRTGREVQGTVQNVLTRGDHHRGIKVRLTDGRIGRVQSVASRSSTSSSPATGSPLPENPTSHAGEQATRANGAASHQHGIPPRYRDIRLDGHLEPPPEQIDLAAYIVPSKRKGKGKGKKAPSVNPSNDSATGDAASHISKSDVAAEAPSTTATCPVCGVFEGDEAAVSHHVAEHFQ
ncbi:hypothetical protein F4779DRAFT_234329 [Xylariaceae sp. FL0662B]|nr:hypothetical protein F4779DRAFT_234329 [Xylariaceae sp. FL0662B]